MKCFKCKKEIKNNSKFCSKCGIEQGVSEELIEEAKNGNKDAMAILYNSTYSDVYYTIKYMIKDEDITLDLLQDSYIRGFSKLFQLKDCNKFRSWIKRIAQNLVIDYLRKDKSKIFSQISTDLDEVIEFEDDRVENLPDVVVDKKETSEIMKQILSSLSEEQYIVVIMYYYQQLTVKEIADILQINENTVKSRLSYARKKIEVQVKDLEKQGIKLYGLAPIPFLLLLFKNIEIQLLKNPDISILQFIEENMSSSKAINITQDVSQQHIKETILKGSSTSGKIAKGFLGIATKGVAIKVVGVVTSLVVISGTFMGVLLHNKNQYNNETNKPLLHQDVSNKSKEKLKEEEIYQSIIDEYAKAISLKNDKKLENNLKDYHNVNQIFIKSYHWYKMYTSLEDYGFFYDYYDIDNNGVKELVILQGLSNKRNIIDVYSIKNGQPHKLFNHSRLGKEALLSIYTDGSIVLDEWKGYNVGGTFLYKLNKDGTDVTDPVELQELIAKTPKGISKAEKLVKEKLKDKTLLNLDTLDWKFINPIKKANPTNEDVYYDIIEEYKSALLLYNSDSLLSKLDRYRDINKMAVSICINDKENYDMMYAFYDVDKNGVDEMLISSNITDIRVVDIYANDNGTPKKLFDKISFGEGTGLYIYTDGSLITRSFSGQYTRSTILYKFGENGVDFEKPVELEIPLKKNEQEIIEANEYIEKQLKDKKLLSLDTLNWKSLIKNEDKEEYDEINDNKNDEQNKIKDEDSYIGNYTGSIEKKDTAILKISYNKEKQLVVKFQALKNDDAEEYTTVFEEKGILQKGDIVVDIPNEMEKIIIKKEYKDNFYNDEKMTPTEIIKIDASKKLKEKLGYDLSIYDLDYYLVDNYK